MFKNNTIKKLFFLGFLIGNLGHAQRVTMVVDSTQIKIGSQFHIALKTKVKSSDRVQFPSYTNIGQLEVLESFPVDTVKEQNQLTLIKKYGVTQFDSGTYKIPPLQVVINNKSFQTDSSSIIVNDVAVDTLTQPMFDIKDISAVEKPSFDWWRYLVFMAALLLVGVFTYFILKRLLIQKGNVFEQFASPIEKALAHLKTLEKKQLWQNDNVKEYYSEFTDISRVYIEESLKIPAKESTSKELFTALRSEIKKRQMHVDSDLIEQFEKVLTKTDLVKFAKLKPINFEIEQDTQINYKFLVSIDKSIPRTEEEIQNMFLEEKKCLKSIKDKKIKRVLAIGVLLLGIVISALVFALTIGYPYIKENYIGYTTKELLEKEPWIVSTYGYPGISVETPKALTREIDERVQQNLPQNVKSLSQFTYGTLEDDFYILLKTTTLKDTSAVDKTFVIEKYIKELEQKGATTIFTKEQDYQNMKGFTGKKVYGTFLYKKPEETDFEKMSYEIVVFTQAFGIQEFIFVYKEKDQAAKKIIEKVSNSVELSKFSLNE